MELFRKTIADRQNSLISPLSVILALSMAANGADGETLTQMEKLLGGEIPLTELNKYLYDYAKKLPSKEKSKLSIANSIWFRDAGDNGNIYISEVLHKTFISVDELGTKAGAATMISMDAGGAMLPEHRVVDLDRPFVYAIIDNATNLPIFIGTLMTLE